MDLATAFVAGWPRDLLWAAAGSPTWYGAVRGKADDLMDTTFEPNWRSVREHATPQWLKDAKFGIYTHWGPYSVPACGKNGSWYPYNMYRPQTSRDPAQTEH